MFAGCGSPWNTPWRKIISSQASAIRIASRRRSSIGVASRSRSPSWTPSSRSSVSTRSLEYVPYTRGMATRGSSAKLRRKISALRASMR